MSLRVAVFASGGGSNLQALIDHFNARAGGPARVSLVISDRSDAGALERARRASIESVVIGVAERPADFVAREQIGALDGADIDLIALAGYVKLIPAAVVRRYRNRIVNVHPALLPAFGGPGMYGIRVHRAVIASGATVSGATIHMVDERYDEGRILAQWPVPVLAGDTPESLAGRVLAIEHRLYPTCIEALAAALERGEELKGFCAHSASFSWSSDAVPPEVAMRHALGLHRAGDAVTAQAG